MTLTDGQEQNDFKIFRKFIIAQRAYELDLPKNRRPILDDNESLLFRFIETNMKTKPIEVIESHIETMQYRLRRIMNDDWYDCTNNDIQVLREMIDEIRKL